MNSLKIEMIFAEIEQSINNIVSTPLLAIKKCREEKEIIVSIDYIGELKGTVTVAGSEEVFNEISKRMYGMELSEDLLASFAMEWWNMIVANTLGTFIGKGIRTDITPPKSGNAMDKNGVMKKIILPSPPSSSVELSVFFIHPSSS